MSQKNNNTDWLSLAIINVSVMILIIGALEAAILCFLWFPSLSGLLPDSLRYYPVKLYTDLDRTVTREFSVWDPGLTYTLQQSTTVRHKNREFDVAIHTNHMGLRDDERSLLAPDMIAIGDSFTMGFGVEQNDTFAQVIEEKTGLTVLNAGIESYGTAREVLLLKRLDTSNLKYLIVQYCPNDLVENAAFLANNGHLNTLDEQTFISTYDQYRAASKYHFGKYLWYTASHLIPAPTPFISDTEKKQRNHYHARGFLDSLLKLQVDRDKFQLISMVVIDINSSYLLQHDADFDNRLFLDELRDLIASDRYPDFIRNMKLIDVMEALDESDRFILDGHINASGHRKIASLVVQSLD